MVKPWTKIAIRRGIARARSQTCDAWRALELASVGCGSILVVAYMIFRVYVHQKSGVTDRERRSNIKTKIRDVPIVLDIEGNGRRQIKAWQIEATSCDSD